MGLFGSFKKKPEKKTWMVYQDMLGTKKMSVRVDTQYIDKDYKNTFYIKASYCDSSTDDLPDLSLIHIYRKFHLEPAPGHEPQADQRRRKKSTFPDKAGGPSAGKRISDGYLFQRTSESKDGLLVSGSAAS